jgi:hypothetical protein
MQEKKYTFFESYHRALSRVSDARYGRVVRAMSNYVFEGQEPDFADDGDWIVWELVKPILEHGADISRIRSEAGANGGRSGKGVSRNKGNQNASKTIANKSKQKQNNSGKEKDKDKENIKILSDEYFSLNLDERKDVFWREINENKNYDADTLKRFYAYWSETDTQERMRFELEEIWNTQNRLATFK